MTGVEPGGLDRPELTDHEWDVIVSALRAYEQETRTALRAIRIADVHDPCCQPDARRRHDITDIHRRLGTRMDDIRAVVAKLGYGQPPAAR